MSLSNWADANFRLSAESSSEPGRWRTRPYQREILDSFLDPDIETITLKKSSRVGYTKMLNIDTAYHIQCNPCSQLIVQPTIEDAENYSKEEIDPMIRDNPKLRELRDSSRISDLDESSDAESTMKKKRYPGGILTLVGANSGAGFRRIHARRVKFDEVDGYPVSAGREGDPITLGKRRSDDSWDRKLILGSTPTETDASRIDASYLVSDMRAYHVPCPKCDHLHTLEWANFRFGMDGIGSVTRPVFVCPKCHGEIGFEHQRDMVEAGRWIASAPFRGHAGFRIWAAYSYSANARWDKIAQEFIDCKKSSEKLQAFFNTIVGDCWGAAVEEFEWEPLFKRREAYDSQVPALVRCLTVWIDVQHDRFEWEVSGWGADEECWAIDYRRLNVDTSQPASWKLLREQVGKRYKRADGTTMDVAIVGIDSGYLSDEVYSFCRVNGAHYFIPTKGATEYGKPIIDFPRKRTKDHVYLTYLGTDTAKDLIYARYELAGDGPGCLHHPVRDEFDQAYFKQATVEYRKGFQRAGVTFNRWICPQGSRNEVLDCKVGNLAMVRILQQHRGVDLSTHQALAGVGAPDEAAAEQPKPAEKPPSGHDGNDWIRTRNDWVG